MNVNNSDNWLKGASREKPERTGDPEGDFCGQAGWERLLTLPGEHGEVLTHSLLNAAKKEFVPGRTMSMQTTTSYASHRLGNPGHESRELASHALHRLRNPGHKSRVLTTQLWQGWAFEDFSKAQWHQIIGPFSWDINLNVMFYEAETWAQVT